MTYKELQQKADHKVMSTVVLKIMRIAKHDDNDL